MSYQITHFRKGQWDDYLAFIQHHRRDDSRTYHDLRHKWRVFDNPHDGYFLFAHTHDEIAATLTLSVRRLYTPQGQLPCYELGDGWTAAGHRRRGLFHRLGGCARDIVFNTTPVELIIGAPNPAAVPNWRKHGYVFTPDDGAALLLRPSPVNLAERRALGVRARPIALDTSRPERRAPLLRATLRELTFPEYQARTGHLPRMNDADGGAYLPWRFAASPDGYRFFAAERRGGALLCALRVTYLGSLPTLVVSEYFLNGARDEGEEKLALLPAIARAFYRHHAGLYVNAQAGRGGARYRLLLRHGFIVHRRQAVCYLWKGGATPERRALMEALQGRFQLSDVDVG
jgi:hypothetical protein